MNIAVIGTRGFPYVYSGYENFVAELAPRLVERGHSVTVYCHQQLFSERPVSVQGVRLAYLPAIEHKILSQFTHSLLSTFHACLRRFDVILFVNSANGPFGIVTKALNVRTAINVDGLEWLRPKWSGLGAKYFRFASYLSTRLFDVVIADSERMADIYRIEFGSPSVTIAYGETPEHSSNPGLLSHLRLEPDNYYLVVGRLIPDNNGDIIVKGFEKLASRRKLVVLGDVPYRDSFAESIRKTADARVIFPGYVRDKDLLRELYCNAFAYVHGHEFGGTNPTLLKALASGCCVLALDTPFSREVLDGDNHGIYFLKSPEGVRDAMQKAESSPGLVRDFRRKAHLRILEKYTWDSIVEQYHQLLNDIANAINR